MQFVMEGYGYYAVRLLPCHFIIRHKFLFGHIRSTAGSTHKCVGMLTPCSPGQLCGLILIISVVFALPVRVDMRRITPRSLVF